MDHRKRAMQRLACDRCHGQKLRCIRGPLPSGACQRCIKARETCQYSPPRRLGRPANKSAPKRVNGDKGARILSSGTMSDWPTTPTTAADGLEPLVEEDVSVNFPQPGLEAEVLAPRTSVFPTIPGLMQTQHGGHISSSEPESLDFILDESSTQFTQDWAYVLDSQVANVADSSNVSLTNSGGDLSTDTSPAYQPTRTEPPLQSNVRHNAQGQLSELLRSLYEKPCPMTSNTRRSGIFSQQTMTETIKAANTLLSIIAPFNVLETAASTPNPFSDIADAAESCVDADTVFLVVACYSRIFRNSNALAIALHDAVSSNNVNALQSMPSMEMGTLASFPPMSPAIRSALWVQLLRQSLRELEKRLLALSRPTLQSPPPLQLFPRPLNKSHVADLARSVDADVAGLEVNVNHLLKTTLDMLR